MRARFFIPRRCRLSSYSVRRRPVPFSFPVLPRPTREKALGSPSSLRPSAHRLVDDDPPARHEEPEQEQDKRNDDQLRLPAAVEAAADLSGQPWNERVHPPPPPGYAGVFPRPYRAGAAPSSWPFSAASMLSRFLRTSTFSRLLSSAPARGRSISYSRWSVVRVPSGTASKPHVPWYVVKSPSRCRNVHWWAASSQWSSSTQRIFRPCIRPTHSVTVLVPARSSTRMDATSGMKSGKRSTSLAMR